MGDSAEKSDEERENTISDKNEATSNITSATTDHRGDDVGAINGLKVDDSFKLSMEGTEATPLAVTSKILHKVFSGVHDRIPRVSVLMELLTTRDMDQYRAQNDETLEMSNVESSNEVIFSSVVIFVFHRFLFRMTSKKFARTHS